MDMYLYRLWDFDFEDENDDDLTDVHECAHIIETKLKSVLPMIYGYFDIGMNYIEIYPYHTAMFPAKPILIFNEEEHESTQGYSLLFPYQNKTMAKDIFSKWLKACGYEKAAKAVKKNAVGHLSRMSSEIPKETVAYAKHWDKIKVMERNVFIYKKGEEEQEEH